jgi:replicative DNA helicase
MNVNYSAELEMRVLENIMSIGEIHDIRVQNAMLMLTPDCFYKQVHLGLFELIKREFLHGNAISFVDVLVLIPKNDIQSFETLNWIMDNNRNYGTSTRSLEDDVDKLITYSTLRKQINAVQKMLKEVPQCADANEAQKLLSDKVNEISKLTFRQSKHGQSNIEIAEMFYDGLLEKDLIIPTSCDLLNAALDGGVRTKSLITVAGAAGNGKTGFAIFLMDAIARPQAGDKHSLFFSLEMESKHIWMRHAGIRGGMQFDKMNPEQQNDAIMSALQIPMTIYDVATTPACSDLEFIVTTCRLKAMEKPISVIVVDYLGLVQNHGNFENNALRQADVTTQLARLAMELDCVVIALSQVNRQAAQRSKDEQCPYPHDAADSSGSHRSSTLWLGIDRPETYQDDPCYKNQFVVKCRKNRFGNNFELTYAFNAGTFGKVQPGYFKKPYKAVRSNEEALFSAIG